jgi:ubiquinone/menaquinone biosynthesis C-methylase UbiE
MAPHPDPTERYTPGHTPGSVAFMAARSATEHAAFFLPHLRPGMSLLDCGCGPGQITLGLAEAVRPGRVVGVDRSGGQFAPAAAAARARGLHVDFREASVYALPFAERAFDAAFAHALLEHLADPVAALREMARVVRPGAPVAACSPDWGGFVVTPPSPELDAALEAYTGLQRANGGEPLAGRHLAGWMRAAGLTDVEQGARYERYPRADGIADYLATQLEAAGLAAAAGRWRAWAAAPDAMFAQTWVSAIARAPSG